MIADRYAAAKAALDAAQKTVDELRKEIIELNTDRIVGSNFVVNVQTNYRASIDSKLVKTILTESQLELVTRISPVTVLRVNSWIW